MRKVLVALFSVGLLVAVIPAAAAGEPAEVSMRQGTFPVSAEFELCNGDTIAFEGVIAYTQRTVRNKNGAPYHSLTRPDEPIIGVSLTTGQEYRRITTEVISAQTLDNSDADPRFLLFANSHWIALGGGPEHGIVQLRHYGFDGYPGVSFRECKA